MSEPGIRRPYEKFGDASEEAGCVGKVMDYVYEEPSEASKDAC